MLEGTNKAVKSALKPVIKPLIEAQNDATECKPLKPKIEVVNTSKSIFIFKQSIQLIYNLAF